MKLIIDIPEIIKSHIATIQSRWQKLRISMIYKIIEWFKRNACKKCDYYCSENNVCQSKKCATCGCHPYVNWFDRHFCQPYKAESEHIGDTK